MADTRTGSSTWTYCHGCRTVLFALTVARNLGVCPECGRHQRLTATDRLAQLLDPGSAELLEPPAGLPEDPLGFVDTQPYLKRLEEARRQTGLAEAAVCSRGTIGMIPVIVAAMDFRFLGGSLGGGAGELITLAAEAALLERRALVIVTASGGARMQEGILSLMQMAKVSQAIGRLDEAALLTVTVVTDPTYGGVAASFAALGDVIIAEPGARLGFAGPRVIEQTIHASPPPGFQTAESVLRNGMIDMVVPRPLLRTTLAAVLTIGTGRRRDDDGDLADPRVVDPSGVAAGNPADSLALARALDRPTALDYARMVLDQFVELHGDRVSGDCTATVGGLGTLAGTPIVFIGTQKGHTAAELVSHNHGMPVPSGYRKAARLMRMAAKLGLPVVTFVDTPGAYPGIEAEERGQAVAIAENLRLMSALPVPVVAVLTGEGGSGGALALGVADQVLMLANATYSVISPEGCAAILWRDTAAAQRAAAALQIDARSLLARGVIDAIVPEPAGGAQRDAPAMAAALRAALNCVLRELRTRPASRLVAERRARFRGFCVAAPALAGTMS